MSLFIPYFGIIFCMNSMCGKSERVHQKYGLYVKKLAINIEIWSELVIFYRPTFFYIIQTHHGLRKKARGVSSLCLRKRNKQGTYQVLPEYTSS